MLLERCEAFGLGERKTQGPNGHFRKLSTHFVSCSVCVLVIIILFLLFLSLLNICLHLLEEFLPLECHFFNLCLRKLFGFLILLELVFNGIGCNVNINWHGWQIWLQKVISVLAIVLMHTHKHLSSHLTHPICQLHILPRFTRSDIAFVETIAWGKKVACEVYCRMVLLPMQYMLRASPRSAC